MGQEGEPLGMGEPSVSTPDLQPDYDAAWAFMDAMHPGRLRVITGIREVTKPDGKVVKQLPTETFSPSDKAKFLSWAEGAGRDCNLYWHPAEPLKPVTKKMERTDVRAVWHLHVDVDPRAGESLESEHARILGLVRNPPGGLPKPSTIVFSGGGYQAFWALREPIIIDGDLAKAEDAALFNLHIERAMGADKCHSIDHLMRLPFTLNRPDAKKLKKGRVLSLATVVTP